MTQEKNVSLNSLIDTGRELLQKSDNAARTHRKYGDWVDAVALWLNQHHPQVGISAEWSALSISRLVVDGQYDNSQLAWRTFQYSVQTRLTWLSQKARDLNSATVRSNANNNRVFVVHGHDEALREKVARFLERIDLDVIILHEQPNKGRTIIEKFEDFANVGFAVVLLTADDVGGKKGAVDTSLRPRARQNVVFELGYFIGKLGRDRVCALHEPSVEILSDYNGVLYLPLDAGDSWQLHLAKELEAAELPINTKRLFGSRRASST